MNQVGKFSLSMNNGGHMFMSDSPVIKTRGSVCT